MAMLLAIVTIFTGSCGKTPHYQKFQQERTRQLIDEAERQVGFPNIVRFQIKKELKMILEKQDKADLVTFAYAYNPFMGKFVFLGLSLGYGIPFSAQYTNPEQIVYTHDRVVTIPMPDPNGIYPPSSSSATWLLLIDPVTKKINLVYFEPHLTVSEYPLPKNLVSNYPEGFWENYYKGKYHLSSQDIQKALNDFTKE